MKVSLVIPYIDQYDVLIPTITYALENAGQEFELILIDNGSEDSLPLEIAQSKDMRIVKNDRNIGVVQTFLQGFNESTGDIVFFTHSDVLIHEKDWVSKLVYAFQADPKLGLGGLFGARAIGEDGGRADCYSNMLGLEWGKCTCHEVAGQHHGKIVKMVTPATVLDGLGMAFRAEVIDELYSQTDMFADWRSPHHFYDKILSLKTVGLGYHVAVIPIGFDHFSGATSVRGATYKTSMRPWLQKHQIPFTEGAEDQAIYELAERQMFEEFGSSFPITVSPSYEYTSRGAPWPSL